MGAAVGFVCGLISGGILGVALLVLLLLSGGDDNG